MHEWKHILLLLLSCEKSVKIAISWWTWPILWWTLSLFVFGRRGEKWGHRIGDARRRTSLPPNDDGNGFVGGGIERRCCRRFFFRFWQRRRAGRHRSRQWRRPRHRSTGRGRQIPALTISEGLITNCTSCFSVFLVPLTTHYYSTIERIVQHTPVVCYMNDLLLTWEKAAVIFFV